MDWDWSSIETGEWWVLVIALVALAVGAAIGYTAGYNKAKKDLALGRTTTYPSSTDRPLP